MLDVNIFRSQPKRGVYGSVKAGQKSVYPLGVGVNIFCDLARNVFTIKQIINNIKIFIMKKEGWIIISKEYRTIVFAKIFNTEEEAKSMYDKQSLTHIKIEWEE